MSSGAILKRIQVLEEVGSLVESMHENWDGAGLANHWCQRQIPLRSRILRVVVDYFAALKRIGQVPGSSTLAFAEISRHSGTRMTPWSSTTWRCTHRRPRHPATASTERVAIHDLEVGMVLAHDLRTTRGVKLLPEGATLNEKTLEVVRRRHQTDPIIEGARILAFTAILATRRESCSMRRILPPFLMKDMTDDHVPSPFWRPPEGASALTPRWLNGGSAAQQLLVNLSLATTVQSIFRGVVHDVRNRLQVISMVGQTIAEAPDDAALVTKLAPMVVSASREIEADLERLALNPSREVLSPDSLSLSEVTNDVIQLIERLDSSPRVVVRLPHDLPAAQANTHHVSHTLLNLLLNAVEAAEPDECTITITATVTQNTIHLHVQDAGPGVPTHVRANIFDPFFTTKEINRHLGLGLPAARILAISWGGTLTLDSEVETGAKLTLTIPAVDDTPASRR